MKIYANCNKIRPFDGTVTVYDYVVEPAVQKGHDLVCKYLSEATGKIYYMTIPHAEIMKRGTKEETVYRSKFNGPHKTYKCYSFKWNPDDNKRSQTTPKNNQGGHSPSQQPLGV